MCRFRFLLRWRTPRCRRRGRCSRRLGRCAGRAADFRRTEAAPAPRYTETMPALTSRNTVNPEQCGGRPCIRGMRVRVTDVLDLFGAGLNGPEILEELPYLEQEDLQACLQYAAREINHPVLIPR